MQADAAMVPNFLASTQSFWPVYMVLPDGFLFSDVLHSHGKKKKANNSLTDATLFFVLREGEIQETTK